jgi:hypothetical protein
VYNRVEVVHKLREEEFPCAKPAVRHQDTNMMYR